MRLIVPTLVLAALFGCGAGDKMTFVEATEALEQARLSGDGEKATQEPIELSTDFTIGAALDAAAAELRDFWESQIPCTEVTLQGKKVLVDYGTLDDACVYQGRTYAGVHQLEVFGTDPGALDVNHVWDDFTNGDVTLTGTADVRWSAEAETKRVLTNFTWDTRGERWDVSGDHVYGLEVPGGSVLDGITLEGTRAWTNDLGTWDLVMEGIAFSLDDPLPDQGAYTLTNPDGKQLVLGFERVDEDTIRATLDGARWPLVFDVSRTGVVTEVE